MLTLVVADFNKAQIESQIQDLFQEVNTNLLFANHNHL
jgi:hypothetical protein